MKSSLGIRSALCCLMISFGIARVFGADEQNTTTSPPQQISINEPDQQKVQQFPIVSNAPAKQMTRKTTSSPRNLTQNEDAMNEIQLTMILQNTLESEENHVLDKELQTRFDSLLHAFDAYNLFPDEFSRLNLVNECERGTATKIIVRMESILNIIDGFVIHQIRKWHYTAKSVADQLSFVDGMITKTVEIRAFCFGLIDNTSDDNDGNGVIMKSSLDQNKYEESINSILDAVFLSYWNDDRGVKAFICDILSAEVVGESAESSSKVLAKAISAAYGVYHVEFAVILTRRPQSTTASEFSNAIHEKSTKVITDEFLEVTCRSKYDMFDVVVFRCVECDHSKDEENPTSDAYKADQNMFAKHFQTEYGSAPMHLFDALENALNATLSASKDVTPFGECLGHFISYANNAETATSEEWKGHRQFVKIDFTAQKNLDPASDKFILTSVC